MAIDVVNNAARQRHCVRRRERGGVFGGVREWMAVAGFRAAARRTAVVGCGAATVDESREGWAVSFLFY
ncbi:unnamed protein product [Linum trigynum]|uniref:Uncharacterized protein n=1 Tax=Linum trigynum TaxID=586398 RepID=A0AAV2D1S0_9ROSI